MDLVVISTSPSGPVIVNDTTKITVSEESAKAAGDKEGGVPSITYEDIGGLGDAVGRVREMIGSSSKTSRIIQKIRSRSTKGSIASWTSWNRKDIVGKGSRK